MNGKKVLVVDDDPSDRQKVRELLAKDHEVFEAENGQEAITMARLLQPDLILLDIAIPKMDGYTVCYSMKKDPTTKAIPIIMLSALSRELNFVLSRKLGAEEHISKPFTNEVLLDSVGQFIRVS